MYILHKRSKLDFLKNILVAFVTANLSPWWQCVSMLLLVCSGSLLGDCFLAQIKRDLGADELLTKV